MKNLKIFYQTDVESSSNQKIQKHLEKHKIVAFLQKRTHNQCKHSSIESKRHSFSNQTTLPLSLIPST